MFGRCFLVQVCVPHVTAQKTTNVVIALQAMDYWGINAKDALMGFTATAQLPASVAINIAKPAIQLKAIIGIIARRYLIITEAGVIITPAHIPAHISISIIAQDAKIAQLAAMGADAQ